MRSPKRPRSLAITFFISPLLIFAPIFTFAQTLTEKNDSAIQQEGSEAENPYLCPAHWETDRLVDFVVSAEDKPRTIRRRGDFVKAVCEAADRIIENESSKPSWIRIAYLGKSNSLHYHACWGNESSDKKLAELIRMLSQIKNETIQNDKRIKRNLGFLKLEKALIEFGTEASGESGNDQATALIEKAHQFCSENKLTDHHLRLASNLIRVVNLLDPVPVESKSEQTEPTEPEETKWKERRDKEYVRFGKLFEASPDLRMSRYGKNLATSNKDTSQFAGQQVELKGAGLNDETIDISKLAGKIVIVDFWATWCGPCVAEIPKLIELYETLGDSGLEVIGINLDNDVEDARQFIKTKNINWPNVIGADANQISEKYNVRSIPTMMLIDSQGKIILIENRVDELKEKLNSLIEALPN